MLVHDSNVLKFNGFWLGFGSSPTPPTIYHVTVPTVEHGTVSVNPTEGPTGTLVTISTVPDTGYELDTISLTGAELINGNQFYIDGSDVTVNVAFVADYNPLNLPAYTIRLRIDIHNFWKSDVKGTVTNVTSDVIDVTRSDPDWSDMLYTSANGLGILEVLGANTTGVTSMSGLFHSCHKLTSIPIFDMSSVTDATNMFHQCDGIVSFPDYDTHNVTKMGGMFSYCKAMVYAPDLDTSNAEDTSNMFNLCESLKAVPLYDTSKVIDMSSMFSKCEYVESGALALYQQASTQAVPPANHYGTFYHCGNETPSGYAEYIQIPSSWTQGYL